MQTFYYTRGGGDPEILAAKGLRAHVDAKNQSWVYQCAGEEPPTDDGLLRFADSVMKARAVGGGKVCRRQAADLPTFLKGICETSEPPMGFQANNLN